MASSLIPKAANLLFRCQEVRSRAALRDAEQARAQHPNQNDEALHLKKMADRVSIGRPNGFAAAVRGLRGTEQPGDILEHHEQTTPLASGNELPDAPEDTACAKASADHAPSVLCTTRGNI